MKTRAHAWPWLAALVLTSSPAAGEQASIRHLPPPQIERGELMQSLKARHSTREFSHEKLSSQVLSDLLWAAFGINRPDSGGRTAPSTHNWQDIDIYVATADGVYLYDAKANALNRVLAQDIRAQTGTQDFVASAPVNLIYVSDLSRMSGETDAQDQKLAAAIDTGFIDQNVYLYCAANGLATVVRGSIDTDTLAKTLQLKATQWIVAAQSVGYPKQ